MRGSLISAWQYAWQDLWEPLEAHEDSPSELFMELYPEFCKALRPSIPQSAAQTSDAQVATSEVADYFDVSNDPRLARQRFQELSPDRFVSDRRLGHFFEEAFFIIEDFSSELSEYYSTLVDRFLTRYNLRYMLIRPFQLTPTLPGILTGFIQQVELKATGDPHLAGLKRHLERAIELLSKDGRPEDVHKCIGDACNLAEGLARGYPGATAQTLGDLAKELDVWPHQTLREALLKLYGFCSNYPGIRHSGHPGGSLRGLTMKDAVVVSVLLLAFSGYFIDDSDFVEIMCLSGVVAQ
jgi:hypothetical protein